MSSSSVEIRLSIKGEGKVFEAGFDILSFFVSRISEENLEKNVEENFNEREYTVVIGGEKAVREFLRGLVIGIDIIPLSFGDEKIKYLDLKAHFLQMINCQIR